MDCETVCSYCNDKIKKKRFDPNTSTIIELDTEQDRVLFVKSAVLTLLQKARLKLNPKRLYEADGHAAQELAVAIKLLYETNKPTSLTGNNDSQSMESSYIRTNINSKMVDVRACRQIASQLPEMGASLYDLLTAEVNARELRSKALGHSVQLIEAEKSIKQSIVAIEGERVELNDRLANISTDEATLDVKIDKRRKEIDEQQKRLAKLLSFRPQYMDEYERLEAKLRVLYSSYVLKFRNLAYLEQMQSEFERSERQRSTDAEQSMRSAVERMRLQQQQNQMDQLNMEVEEEAEKNKMLLEQRHKAPKVFGNITGAGLSDDDEDGEENNSLLSDDNDQLTTTMINNNNNNNNNNIHRNQHRDRARRQLNGDEDDEEEEEAAQSSADDF